jgi:hypothetical protein
VTRFDGRAARKNPDASTYQQRVFQHAFVATHTKRRIIEKVKEAT